MLRQRVWIDRRVQGVLIGRVILYCMMGLLYFPIAVAVTQYYDQPEQTTLKRISSWFNVVWPWAPSLILMIPLVVYDVIRVSNQFSGPVYRLRKHLSELLEDPNCTPLVFRGDDYWQDLIPPINAVQNQLLALQLALQQQSEYALQLSTELARSKRDKLRPSVPLPLEAQLEESGSAS